MSLDPESILVCLFQSELWHDGGDHLEEEEEEEDETTTSYSLNTPQMHANLHSEFIHSVCAPWITSSPYRYLGLIRIGVL